MGNSHKKTIGSKDLKFIFNEYQIDGFLSKENAIHFLHKVLDKMQIKFDESEAQKILNECYSNKLGMNYKEMKEFFFKSTKKEFENKNFLLSKSLPSR